MNHFFEIKESDVVKNGNKKILDTYDIRRSSRGIIFDENNNIALFHVKKKGYHKTPGGGIEDDESPIIALKREILEETGCTIQDINELCVINEYVNVANRLRIAYFFTAKVLQNTGETNLTIDEQESESYIKWVNIDKAIELVKSEKPNNYFAKFVKKRCLTALELAKELILN